MRSIRVEEGFLSLAETVSSLIALIQGDTVTYVNPAGCATLGRQREELIGRPFSEVVHPESRDAARERAHARQRGEPTPMRFVERLVRPDGSEIWMDYSVDLAELGGQVTTIVTGHDITAAKRLEAELRASEARLRGLSMQAPMMMVAFEIDGSIRDVSNHWLQKTGYARHEVVGRQGYDFVTAESRAALERAFAELARSGGSAVRDVPHQLIAKDGRLIDVLVTSVIEFDERGQPCGAIAVAHDVSELNRAWEALRRSEERFRRLSLQAPVMMLGIGVDRRIREVSNDWLRRMGYAREEVVGREGDFFLTEASRRRMAAAFERRRLTNAEAIRAIPLQAIRKDGSVMDVVATSVVEFGDDGQPTGVIAVALDVSALHESEARYRALVEHAPEVIIVADADTGRFVDCNGNAHALFGLDRDALLARDVAATSPLQQAGGRESGEFAAEMLRRAADGETPIFEWIHLRSDGAEVPCRIHLSRLPAAGRRLVRATITDISREKQLQEQLRHQEKMAAIGLLAAGVAHEIGNPLQALSMAAQSLERKSSDAYARQKLRLIGEHIDRISAIVRRMNHLARPQSAARTRLPLNPTIESALEVARFDRRAKDVAIELDLADLPDVIASEHEVTQVCLNLALNAFDAMSANPPSRERVLAVGTRREGDRARIVFADTGPGVAPEHRSRLFSAFFTTKAAGKGTGLGLSVSQRIVEEHGGRLVYEDDPGGGARFSFDLPLEATP
ncbi:MAG: PAS domain S-box protein [Planctomycetes bacterium]|nr:PAS domain S-box protein [Planctomycetota bacterium]